MISLILPPTSKHTVVFIDKDLSIKGFDHNCPLHITVKCRGLWVPTVIIDNGSAVNICLLRVAYHLGLTKKDLVPSNVAVKAYNSTRRVVEGTLLLKLDAEGFEMDIEFHVLDIPATFNLLLGRPWLHRSDIMAVPSTLHQKVVLGLLSGTLTFYGGSGFSFDTFGSVLAINVDSDFIISFAALDIMRRMSYMPNIYFVHEGGNVAYTGQVEPFADPETRELLPGFEVFGNDTWSDSDEEPAKAKFKRKLNQAKVKTDWLGSFDQGSLELLFQEFSQVGFTEEAKEAEYPIWVANIVPVPKKNGQIQVCVDFRDLNKASRKDDFPLPHIDVLMDNTAGHTMLLFMAATTILHDMIHREVEVYVDYMIVKSKTREGHIPVLRSSSSDSVSFGCVSIHKNALSELQRAKCLA
ncbi:uncharacterized protein LOC131302943 [Rhododendron vialii]|uniref:uncharacterized protein LOC131302943 n=1 Tax=Rhododendron vialii TaxID=182163 RepID=UPI00265D8E9C|nr:uncharacterized protein LOC131302943 [Rhododendron vialii]